MLKLQPAAEIQGGSLVGKAGGHAGGHARLFNAEPRLKAVGGANLKGRGLNIRAGIVEAVELVIEDLGAERKLIADHVLIAATDEPTVVAACGIGIGNRIAASPVEQAPVDLVSAAALTRKISSIALLGPASISAKS